MCIRHRSIKLSVFDKYRFTKLNKVCLHVEVMRKLTLAEVAGCQGQVLAIEWWQYKWRVHHSEVIVLSSACQQL